MRLLLLAVIVGCWIVVTPPNGGPDETSHFTRGAAVVRGDPNGVYTGLDSSLRYFDIPSWIGWPDPVCFAFKPEVDASCLLEVPLPPEDAQVAARGYAYPVWSQFAAGVGSLIGSPRAALYWARGFDALLPLLLIGWTLSEATRRGQEAIAATMLTLSPMAVFSVAVINPSGLALAGGLAFFAGWIWSVDDRSRPQLRWLAVLGWAALILPRRDGLIWGCIAIAVWLVMDDEPLRARIKWLGRWGLIACAATTAVVVLWALGSASRVTRSLVLVPLIIPVAGALKVMLRRVPRSRVGRGGAIVVGLLLGGLSTWAMLALQPNGASWTQTRLVVESTGGNLREAIGVLGWLDTALPELAYALWGLLLGLLLVIGAVATPRSRLFYAGVMAVVAVLVSWFLELYGDVATGTYWQGRYWLPVLPAVTLALASVGRGRRDELSLVRLANLCIWGSLALLNIAIWAAARRWGVGVAGTYLPWRWNTYGAPVAVSFVLVVHLAASAGLAVVLTHRASQADRALPSFGSGGDTEVAGVPVTEESQRWAVRLSPLRRGRRVTP